MHMKVSFHVSKIIKVRKLIIEVMDEYYRYNDLDCAC